MNKILLILILIFTSLINPVYGSKDKPLNPIKFEFIIEGRGTIICGQDSILELICNEIASKKVILIEVKIVFKPRQFITIKYENQKIIAFEIHRTFRKFHLPNKVISKIEDIEFHSFYAVQNQYDHKLFNRNYFILHFTVRSIVHYERLPQIRLLFKHNKFKEGYKTTYTGVDSYVRTDLNE